MHISPAGPSFGPAFLPFLVKKYSFFTFVRESMYDNAYKKEDSAFQF